MSPPPTPTSADAIGFVLAGGRSSRMGSDKALLQLGREPLVARALSTLGEAGLETSIAGSRSDLCRFAPVIPDPGAGPLSGICAALALVSSDLAVFVTVDMPLIPASLIRVLLNHTRLAGAAATVPSINGVAQTFPAVLHRSTLPHLEAALQQAEGGCFAGFKKAADRLAKPFCIPRIEMLIQSGEVSDPNGLPGAYWFLNVNTPQDLSRAEALLAGTIA